MSGRNGTGRWIGGLYYNVLFSRLLRILLQEAIFMCRRNTMIGGALAALGAGLLVSMLIPRSIWTILLGVALILLGVLLSEWCK